jgi:glutamyl-Q tRNA(Asp) synthetase
LRELRAKGCIYDCTCSRREILASAPHPGEEGPVYPGTCRAGIAEGRSLNSVRIRVPEESITFTDGVFGAVTQCLAKSVGDFVLRRSDGLFAYQLAVVIDDAHSGVTQVVRGADLLTSTPRQIYLHHCLNLPVPAYLHLPLALAPSGEKISKRHGFPPGQTTRGEQVRDALGFLGQDVPRELVDASPTELLGWGILHFDSRRIPHAGGQISTKSPGLSPDEGRSPLSLATEAR